MYSSSDIDGLLEPVQGSEPGGPDLSYDPEFLALERNAQALTGSGPPPAAAWRTVAREAEALLRRTKDLRVAMVLVRTWVVTEGWTGLRDGLALLGGLLDRYWLTLHPPLDSGADPSWRLNILAELDEPQGLLLDLEAAPLTVLPSGRPVTLADLALSNADDELRWQIEVSAAFRGADEHRLRETLQLLREAAGHLVAIGALLGVRAGRSFESENSPLVETIERATRYLEGALKRGDLVLSLGLRADQSLLEVTLSYETLKGMAPEEIASHVPLFETLLAERRVLADRLIKQLPTDVWDSSITAAEAPSPPAAPSPPEPTRVLDEDVQFTVYRPRSLVAQRWYTLLAFAHLAEPRDDAPADEPDPVEEVRRQAAKLLEDEGVDYQALTEDSTEAIPREGELTFVPYVAGIEFNPVARSFRWTEAVHCELFRVRADANLAGQVVRGRLSVFLGSILIGEIGLRFRVVPLGAQVSEREPQESSSARPYRKIFPSYAHADTAIVEQFERYAASVGDRYLRDVTTLRSGEVWDERLGELIAEADVFQLFWSTCSMISPFVRKEWERALALERRHFIRPVYWEDPLPENPAQGLPPTELGRLHFQRIPWVTPPPASAVATETPAKAPPPKPAVGTSPGPAEQTVLDVTPPEAIPGWPPEPVPSPAPAKRPPDKKGEQSIHSKLGRVRRARVHIAYDRETYGATAHVELPFVIGVLADLSGHTEGPRRALSDREFIPIDRDNFEHVLKEIKPRLALSLRNPDSGEIEYLGDLAFETLDDFRPAALAPKLAETTPDSGMPEHLASLVNRVLHHTEFQRLESAWRGLHYLANHCETEAQLKLQVLDVSKAELAENLRRFKGTARDRSPLYRLLHDLEYEWLGGEPYGLLVADYHFDHRPPDVELLSELGMIGSVVHAPIVAGLAPSVLGLAGWEALATVPDVARLLDSDDHAGWRFLRESEPSRFICLTLPRVLARLPYSQRTHPGGETDFEEDVSGLGLGGYVWMNAAYVMAVNVARAFSRDGWPVRIRGVEGGGAADDLPLYAFEGTPGEVGSTRSTEVLIDDRREYELTHSGFNALVQSARGATPVFLTAQTLQKPATHDEPQATVSAHLGVQLPYLLVLCRFAQHMRCMIRDSASVPTETTDLERWLGDWLAGYVSAAGSTAAEVDHQRPLAAAQVHLEETPGPRRCVRAQLRLQPRYQLQDCGAWFEIDFQLALA